MSDTSDFHSELEHAVREQLRSQRVGYLLGAGSSYLGGNGYPLAAELWDCIAKSLDEHARADIQKKLDGGATGIEEALDQLDDGGATETEHRREVTKAIAEDFRSRCLNHALDAHIRFVQRLAGRSDRPICVYSLNYDSLVEHAADQARVRLTDGFLGTEHAFFDGSSFGEAPYLARGTHKGRQLDPARRPIQLLKLHGSLGWYEDEHKVARRCAHSASPPEGSRLLMVPPQRRKAAETTHAPYSALWSRFRGSLAHDERPLNRLACFGYGFADHHVNEVIEPALARSDFTLLIFAKFLTDEAWQRWSPHKNSIVITEDRCSLYGTTGPGHADLWDFQRIAKEV